MTKMRRWVPVAMVMVLGAWWGWQRPPVDSSESVHRSVETLPQGASVHHHPGSSDRELGVAPPGRGKRTIAQEDSTTEQHAGDVQPYPPPEPHMNGEVVAWVVNQAEMGWNDLAMVSVDCGIRATVREGQAFVLVPPGDCDFQLVNVGPIETPVSEMQVVTVTAGETTTVEWVLFPSVEGVDTGV